MQQEAKTSYFSLKKDFIWILTGNLYYAATQYALLIAVTRLTSPETVGRFSLALAINAPISLFLSLSLRAVLISDSKNEYSLPVYLSIRILTSIVSIVVVAGIVLGGHYSPDLAYPILLIGLVKAVESIADLIYGIFQKQFRNYQIAISICMRGTLSCALCVFILTQTQSLTQMCVGLLGSSMAILFFFDCVKVRDLFHWRSFRTPSGSSVKKLIALSIPLAFALVFSSLELNVPRYLVEHRIGLTALGIFSALSYPLMLGNQIVGALASAASPHLADLYHQWNLSAFKHLLLKLVLGGSIVGAGTAFICFQYGTPILSLLKHVEYMQESSAFSVLALAAGISYVTVFFGAALSAMRCFRLKFLLQIFSFAFTGVCAYIASSHQSVYAMSIAILAGSFFSFIIQLITFLVRLKKSPSQGLAL